MITTYTKEDLISFGNYLLSEERKNRFEDDAALSLEERLNKVHDADYQNWECKYEEHTNAYYLSNGGILYSTQTQASTAL